MTRVSSFELPRRVNVRSSSQRAQEIQKILLRLGRQTIVVVDYAIGFRALAGVLLNRVNQSSVGRPGTAIVQEEDALANSPKRSGAKFIRARCALRNIIRETGAHMMHHQIGI